MTEFVGTGQAARLVTQRLGIDPPLTERRLNRVLRYLQGVSPAIVAGRRIWTPEDVDRLASALQQRLQIGH
jgi:hypothetical protein